MEMKEDPDPPPTYQKASGMENRGYISDIGSVESKMNGTNGHIYLDTNLNSEEVSTY